MRITSCFYRGRVFSPQINLCSPLQKPKPWFPSFPGPNQHLKRLLCSPWSGWVASPVVVKRLGLIVEEWIDWFYPCKLVSFDLRVGFKFLKFIVFLGNQSIKCGDLGVCGRVFSLTIEVNAWGPFRIIFVLKVVQDSI